MTWLIIILVLALIIGPVMYLKPTARDKRVVALRALARTCGLHVAMHPIAKLDASADERVSSAGQARNPTRLLAGYGLAHELDLSIRDAPVLHRIPDAPTLVLEPVAENWAFISREGKADWWTDWAPTLTEWLAELPQEVVAVSVDSRFILCYWHERAEPESGIVERIARAVEDARMRLSS